MVRTILKRVVALTAWGFSAANKTISPAVSAIGLPATVISASPSIACTSAANGEVCSVNACPASNAKIVTFPFSPFRDNSAYDGSVLIIGDVNSIV